MSRGMEVMYSVKQGGKGRKTEEKIQRNEKRNSIDENKNNPE